jgi:DNA polymerase III subunit epsilon
MPNPTLDRLSARDWARSLLHHDNWRILDTETTGLDRTAEIIQVGILSGQGEVIFDRLVKPIRPIPWETTRIHHITDRMVSHSPNFPQIYTPLQQVLSGKTVIIYNASFDLRMLRQSCELHYLRPFNIAGYACAMQKYAAFAGQLNANGRGYRLQRLQGGDHSALGDCAATLKLIQHMADW